MRRLLIILANCALLVLLAIGLPAAARARWGDVQFSSVSTNQHLMFAGLAIAGVLNFVAAVFLFKQKPQKILCWEWTVVFGVLLLVFFAHTRGWLEFAWLTHALQWLQKHL
jgi:hypothetical protein